MLFKSSLCILALLSILSCNSYIRKDKGDGVTLTAEEALNPSYATIQNKIVQPYCLSCHGSDGGVNLENYANVVRFINPMSASIEHGYMPPGQPLPNDLKQLLSTWVANGHPENGIPMTPPPPVDLVPTFASISKNILEPKCASCHDSSGDTPITDYAYLKKSSWVVSNNLEKSLLYQSIVKGEMPPDGKLSDLEIKTINTWISNGANND